MTPLQVIVIIFALFAISRIFINIKSRNILKLEALFWGLLWVGVILVSIFPDQITYLANVFGIERGIDIVIYIGLVVLAYLIFRLYAKLRLIDRKVTKIIRTIALRNSKK